MVTKSNKVDVGINSPLVSDKILQNTPAVVVVNNEALAKILKVKPGKELIVSCKNGVPHSREWRNRFRDAKKDKCITIRQNVGKPKEPPKREEK